MSETASKKTIKGIVADLDKCIGCRACEMACSAFHANPRYGSVNPARSRIRVLFDELKDIYVPVRATHNARTECAGRQTYLSGGKNYRECIFCGASCPSRNYFREPDSGLPLKCDMCESVPSVDEPLCVKVCTFGALAYIEREEEICADSENEQREMQRTLELIVDKYGLELVSERLSRITIR